ncbi:MAG: hypothetical protein Q4G03_03930 [Planctomycetia bacterium]|nr:hypothetical protein [Planctomycetia bacterium]
MKHVFWKLLSPATVGAFSASRVLLALTLVVGVVLGALVRDWSSPVRAQSGLYANPGSSESLNEALRAQSAPRLSVDSNGQTRFSRPLEVPPLYAFDAPLGDTGRQIVLVDSQTKRICVYWIRQRDVNSTIELVATRSFELDLKLENFNGEGLAPAQIREQLESINR